MGYGRSQLDTRVGISTKQRAISIPIPIPIPIPIRSGIRRRIALY